MTSEQRTQWYLCPACGHTFDIPADKPPCPKCGERLDYTDRIRRPEMLRTHD